MDHPGLLSEGHSRRGTSSELCKWGSSWSTSDSAEVGGHLDLVGNSLLHRARPLRPAHHLRGTHGRAGRTRIMAACPPPEWRVPQREVRRP